MTGVKVAADDAAAWALWLEANHATSRGAWLLRGRGVQSGRFVAYEEAICEALCFGWIDGPVRVFDEVSSGLWFAPRQPKSGWAATNKARIARLEAEGRLRPPGIRALEVARANGAWEVLDGPEAGIEPPDLTAALDAVPTARRNWDAFPPSSRKFGLTQIAMAVRPQTREARIAKIVADAAEGKRPLIGEDRRMDDRTLWLLTAFLITAGTLVAFLVQWRRSRRGGRDPFDGPGDGTD